MLKSKMIEVEESLLRLEGLQTPTIGRTFYAKKSTDSDFGLFRANKANYSDGVAKVYTTIQSAVDASISGRGDAIIVGSGKWTEEVVIVGKTGLKIKGAGNGLGATEPGGVRMRPSDAAVHYGFTTKSAQTVTGAAFHVLSRAVEISGFYFDGGGGYTGIYLGGGLNGGVTGYTTETAAGSWIHNNFFRGGSEGAIGLYMNGAKFGVLVENNFFERWTRAAIQMDAGNASNEHCIIRNNEIGADDSGTCYGIEIYGEGNSALDCLVRGNSFRDRAATNVFTFGIINNALSTGGLSVAGNFFACASAMSLLATDYHCGNFKGTASATEVYVSEA